MPPSPQEYAAELARLLDAVARTLARDARHLESSSHELLDVVGDPSRTSARSIIRGLQDTIGPLMHCAIQLKQQHERIERLAASSTKADRPS